MRTCGNGFDIWSFLVGFLGVSMSPIFQMFKLYNSGFGKKFKIEKTSLFGLKIRSNSMYITHSLRPKVV
jgi:hypothetical protein